MKQSCNYPKQWNAGAVAEKSFDKVYHSKSCWLNAFAANLSFKNKYGSDACSMKRLVIKIIQSPERIKIDARCYFTSKCKISPRVIYFIQIHSEQAESPDHAVSIFSMI